ncbi:MAG: thioredoxin family protein [Saprospiraceae bacterium]|nr:thioredoxin family protein [Saprospiraceae bacterium]
MILKKLLALSLLLSWLFATSFSNGPTGYVVGDTAQDFNLKNVDGKMVSLAAMGNTKGYIVVFTCNHCPYAQAYEARVIELHKKFAPLGYPVVAINSNDKDRAPDDSYELMVERAKENGYPFPYLYDDTQSVAKAFGALRTPHVFVLDQQKVVRYIGAIDDNAEDPAGAKVKYVENAVNALNTGQEIAVKETRAIGCGIKWKQ